MNLDFAPSLFEVSDRAEVWSILKKYSFANIITSNGNHDVFCSRLPFIINENSVTAHIAKSNPQSETLKEATKALVVFDGPHSYISPTWYKNPAKSVPTWNYIQVKIRGEVKIHSPEELRNDLKQLTSKYETDWSYDSTYLKNNQLEKMIVGFSVQKIKIVAKAKLSQNKSQQEIKEISTKLKEKNQIELVHYMKLLSKN